MRSLVAIAAAVTILAAITGSAPATAMPAAKINGPDLQAATTNIVDVRWRHRHWRRYHHWRRPFVRRYWAPPVYAYGYYPRYRRYYYYPYYPGPYIRFGPFAFGIW